jgi:MYND finger
MNRSASPTPTPHYPASATATTSSASQQRVTVVSSSSNKNNNPATTVTATTSSTTASTAGTANRTIPPDHAGGNNSTLWSGLETAGMRDAKCSLLLQEEATHDAKIKTLPKQRVLVYQDKGFNPASSAANKNSTAGVSSSSTGNNVNNSEENFYVDFKGATVLQLEPTLSSDAAVPPPSSSSSPRGGGPASVMPITLTVGGRCVFTPENYQDFRVMMRTKDQSAEMSIAPNGSFDWPDVNSLLLCPCCGSSGPIPRAGDKQEHEYWMVFYPLLQITVLKGSQMTLGTRTICRLVCLDCMDDLLEGLTLEVVPGGIKKQEQRGRNIVSSNSSNSVLSFTLPVVDVLAEAGSASFLEDGPPRPESHPHVDDILDAWTLYNMWEHSGAWEALQNDYRITLSRSMHADSSEQKVREVALKNRIGMSCGNPACTKVHGRPIAAEGGGGEAGEICRLYIKCRECHSEYYCSKECRQDAKDAHSEICLEKRREREERREKKAKKVECDTCSRKFPYTKMKKCSSCRNATYCSVDCQRMDWQRHKYNCKR